jgi:serine/threonine protein phosphatase PrpC
MRGILLAIDDFTAAVERRIQRISQVGGDDDVTVVLVRRER